MHMIVMDKRAGLPVMHHPMVTIMYHTGNLTRMDADVLGKEKSGVNMADTLDVLTVCCSATSYLATV